MFNFRKWFGHQSVPVPRRPSIGRWRCPSCGAVFEKKADTAELLKMFDALDKMGAKTESLSRCGQCGNTVNSRDIYSGEYDVDA